MRIFIISSEKLRIAYATICLLSLEFFQCRLAHNITIGSVASELGGGK